MVVAGSGVEVGRSIVIKIPAAPIAAGIALADNGMDA